MIDKIVIELDDTGMFLINLGDVHLLTVQKPSELAYVIHKYCKVLAHFPQGLPCGMGTPIPFEDFEKMNKVSKKKKDETLFSAGN